MNERIKELERQATDYYSNGQERIFDRQKFAELIVAECVSVLTLTVAEGSIEKMNLSGYMLKLVTGIGNQYANGIKEHFGVEE